MIAQEPHAGLQAKGTGGGVRRQNKNAGLAMQLIISIHGEMDLVWLVYGSHVALEAHMVRGYRKV